MYPSIDVLCCVVLSAEKRLLYEFIVCHFLASCSKDAVGYETTVAIDIAGELFKATGQLQLEKVVDDKLSWQGHGQWCHGWWRLALPPSVAACKEAWLDCGGSACPADVEEFA